MRTIDMFSNVAGQMVRDAEIQRYGTILVSHGARGLANLNPTAVWVDATIAVIEASGSYFRYCAEREVTQQLRNYNQTLEAILAQELPIAEMKLGALLKEREGRLAHIERTLNIKKRSIQLARGTIRQQIKTLKDMHVLLQQERQQIGCFQDLIGLQVCLDRCIDATLALLLSPDGEHA